MPPHTDPTVCSLCGKYLDSYTDGAREIAEILAELRDA
jgi:hypothetical protein